MSSRDFSRHSELDERCSLQCDRVKERSSSWQSGSRGFGERLIDYGCCPCLQLFSRDPNKIRFIFRPYSLSLRLIKDLVHLYLLVHIIARSRAPVRRFKSSLISHGCRAAVPLRPPIQVLLRRPHRERLQPQSRYPSKLVSTKSKSHSRRPFDQIEGFQSPS